MVEFFSHSEANAGTSSRIFGVESDADRFQSMSITRNAANAVIREDRRQFGTRVVNSVRDIEGATPRALPKVRSVRDVRSLTDVSDIEGAAPKTLHRTLPNGPIEKPEIPGLLLVHSFSQNSQS